MEHKHTAKQFHAALRRLAKTEDGKIVLETLQGMYVDSISFANDNTNLTMYRLGQKELIQGIIQDSEREEQLIQTASANDLDLIGG